MSQCLRITFIYKVPKDFMQEIVLKHARAIGLEGTAQLDAQEVVRVVVCGKRNLIDDFIDVLHADLAKKGVHLELEPFIKDRDYRGVFRVIE